MSYFGFLARFVVLPLILLRLLLRRDRQRGHNLPDSMQNWPEDEVLLAHVIVAVSYTTPWDNYLVASNIWSYDPELVTGMTIGWVPVEEYSFFVLQSLLTGSWLQVLARRIPVAPDDGKTYPLARAIATSSLALLWLATVRDMSTGNPATTYRDLIVGWALPPIMLQVGFGGDILWRHRRLLATSILSATAYLGFADSLAIHDGTWAINPKKTLERETIPHLPFEELLFFSLTNVLLSFGVTLVLNRASESRIPASLRAPYERLKSKWLTE